MVVVMKSGIHWNCSTEKRSFDLALATLLTPVDKAASSVVRKLVERSCGIDMNPVVYDERLGVFGEIFWSARYRTTGPGDASRLGRWAQCLQDCGLDRAAQLRNIRAGEMGFVGPQPVSKKEYESTMESLTPYDQRKWTDVLKYYVPGYISSYMVDDLATRRAEDTDLGLRAELDIMDAAQTSPVYDARLFGQCASLAIARHLPRVL